MAAPDTFISHLIELRDRLLRSILAIIIVFLCLFPWARDIYALLAEPLLRALPRGGQMIATEVTTPFFVPMKVTLMAAFVIALPFVLYQLWAFVAPGLYANEKRLVGPLIIASTLLFICGMGFAYFLVFPMVFGFVIRIAPQGVAVMTDIGKYLDFVLTMFVAFGIAFEMPVAVVLLVKMGVVSVAQLKQVRPYAIVGAFVIGAIFTPPDVVSQIMLAVPLWLLFEVGLVVAGFISKPGTAVDDYRPLTEPETDDIETNRNKRGR
ncbi:MAG TPA: twin-arginine translocase subunit TatC [Burkholderiales bacterium]|nr:twin-arginine translocase subunit TatC [Burkholderiales bacterium]